MATGTLDLAMGLAGKAGKPAYIEFAAVAKHLPKRSEAEGRYVAVDVDMVTVRQLGAPDSSIFEVTRWLAQNKQDVTAGRLPREHADYYEKAYRYWKEGQEMPCEGTPIKGWAVISPAQADTIIRFGLRTVEQLATINGEVMQRIGMGAVDIKNKAMAWVAQAQDKGPLTMQMSALQKQNDVLTLNQAKLTEQLQALQAERKTSGVDVAHATASAPDPLSAEELFADDSVPQVGKRKR